MKIAYVLNKFPKLSETFILHEMLQLEQLSNDLHVFALSASDEGKIHRGVADLDAPVHYLKAQRREVAQRLAGRSLRSWAVPAAECLEDLVAEGHRDPLRILLLGVELAVEVEGEGIDAFHAHFFGDAARVASIASLLLEIPFSVTCHAKDIYHDSVNPAAVSRLMEAASFVVTVCEANRQHLQSWLGQPYANLHVINNGIDLDLFHPMLREPAETPIVLGVGRLIEKKGFDDLIRASAELERDGVDHRCVIIGEGREREALGALAQRASATRVEFTGALTQEQVRDWMARATVLAQPCIIAEDGNRDALPTVLLEALAMGLPVVSTDVVGIPEIVGEELQQLLVPERSPADLAARLRWAIDEPQTMQEIGRRERARAEAAFDRRKNVTLIHELMSASTTPVAG